MFTLLFTIILALFAIPLIRAIWRLARHAEDPQNGWFRPIATLCTGIAGIVILCFVLSIHGEVLWFEELGQAERYWIVFKEKWTLFCPGFVAAYLLLLCSVPRAYRRFRSEDSHAIPIAIAAAAALPFGLGAMSWWNEVLLAFNQVGGEGNGDPIFGKSVGFYLFTLPVYQDLASFLLWLVLVNIGMVGLLGVIASVGISNSYGYREKDACNAALRNFWRGTIPQFAFLASLLLFAVAWMVYLERYDLMYSTEGVVAGPGYTDVYGRIPMYWVTVIVSALCGCVFLRVSVFPAVRAWYTERLFRLAAVPTIWLAVVLLCNIGYPAFLYHWIVKSNEITVEPPYLEYSIAATRDSFGLHAEAMVEQEFPISSELNADVLEKNRATLENIRLWDPRELTIAFVQTQKIRGYYEMVDADVDRYVIGGRQRQVMVTARELNTKMLPEKARGSWVNLHLKYTHGHGVVVNPVNSFLPNGSPELLVRDIPAVSTVPELNVTRGEVYYGERTNEHVYVGTTESEFDYSVGDENHMSSYTGSGGIPLSSLWRKLVFAWKFDGHRLFLSTYFKDQSRIMFRRQIQERIQALAPFLKLDRDPYLVIDQGRLFWIQDAYTTSRHYPYAAKYHGDLKYLDGINYIRNSVKAVIDVYNGTVSLYVFDEADPIIRTYQAIFPKLFQPRSAMPVSLQAHIRYPQDMFQVQAEMYGTYHMTNFTTFFNKEDVWEIAQERYRDDTIYTEPYFVTAQLASMTKPEFLLMVPFTLKSSPRATGWLAGLCDGENYGKLVAYKFPKGQFIAGPLQVAGKVDSDPVMLEHTRLWKSQKESSLVRGNTLALPLVGGALLYAEPLYLEAGYARIPKLVKVVLAHVLPDDQRVVWGDTFDQALDALLHFKTGVIAPYAASTQQQATDLAGSAEELPRLREVAQNFAEYLQLTREGKFAEAGQQLEELRKQLEQYAVPAGSPAVAH